MTNEQIFFEKTGIKFSDYYIKMNPKFISWSCIYTKKDVTGIINDGFMQALEYIHSFDSEKGKINTWVFTIIKHLIFYSERSTVRKISFFYEDLKTYENENYKFVDNITYESEDYKIEYDEEIQKKYKIIISLISNLPEIYKEVIILREIEGHNYDDISSILNLNLSVVKNRIKKGRIILKRNYNIYVNSYVFKKK